MRKLPKLRFRKFNHVGIAFGKPPTRAELLDKINARNLRTDEHGLGVRPRNGQALLAKQSDRVNALPDSLGRRFVRLREGFNGSVREMNVDDHCRGGGG